MKPKAVCGNSSSPRKASPASCFSPASQASQLFQPLGTPQEGTGGLGGDPTRAAPHSPARGLEII